MTKEAIITNLHDNHLRLRVYAAGIPEPLFNRSVDQKWSAAQHLQHIHKSVAQFGKYLSLPKEVIAKRFGKSGRTSISHEQLTENYKRALGQGVKAPASFSADERHDFTIDELTQEGKAILEQFLNALKAWPEEDLDEFVCPHPLLGNLTVREMLYFTNLHALHHLQAIQQHIIL